MYNREGCQVRFQKMNVLLVGYHYPLQKQDHNITKYPKPALNHDRLSVLLKLAMEKLSRKNGTLGNIYIPTQAWSHSVVNFVIIPQLWGEIWICILKDTSRLDLKTWSAVHLKHSQKTMDILKIQTDTFYAHLTCIWIYWLFLWCALNKRINLLISFPMLLYTYICCSLQTLLNPDQMSFA